MPAQVWRPIAGKGWHGVARRRSGVTLGCKGYAPVLSVCKGEGWRVNVVPAKFLPRKGFVGLLCWVLGLAAAWQALGRAVAGVVRVEGS